MPCFSDATAGEKEPHRSPIDIALIGAGRRALVANHSADSVSLVDLDQGKVLAETPCGRKPAAIAVSSDAFIGPPPGFVYDETPR